MKKSLLIFGALVICSSVMAQLNYPASLGQNVAGTYTDLGTNGTAITTSNQNNANSAATPIGFNFNFDGTTMSHFILNTNGFIKLGTSASMAGPSGASLFFTGGGASYTNGIFNSTSSSDVNLLSPFNHDLINGGASTEYRVHTSGTSGSQVCTIQFKNVKDSTTNPYNQFDSVNFQIKLYETTNVIEFVYGTWHSSSDSSRFKSSACGLKGSGTTEITAVTKASTQDWNTAQFIGTNYTGNAFNFGNDNPGNGTGPNGGRPMPDVGRTFRFIPAFNNDIAVNTVYSMGNFPIIYGGTHEVKSSISNVGLNSAVGVKAYLYIQKGGVNVFVDSVTYASLAVGVSVDVTFDDFEPADTGVHEVIVTVNSDDNATNDTVLWRMHIGTEYFAYTDTSALTNALGYTAPGQGILSSKFTLENTRFIRSVDIWISENPNTVGRSIYGAVLNNAGTIVGESAPYTITNADLGNWVSFPIESLPTGNGNPPPMVSNADFYAGAALPGATTTYNPLGLQDEVPTRQGAFFNGSILGGAIPTDLASFNFGRYGIRAHIGGMNIELVEIEEIGLTGCVNPNQTITAIIKNIDSLAVDFAKDSLVVSISSDNTVTQSFSTTLTSGVLEPDSTMSVQITTSFNMATQGIYEIIASAWSDIDIDTLNNVMEFDMNVVDTPSVDLTVSPSNSVCFGTPLTFLASPNTAGTNNTYQWYLNGQTVGSATTDSAYMSSTLEHNDSVYVVLITDHCSSSFIEVTSNGIAMTINPTPLNISGTDSVIENTVHSYVIGLNPNSSFKWSAVGGTLSDTVGTSVQVTWGTANPNASISVTESDNMGCVYTSVQDIYIFSIVGEEELSAYGISVGDVFPNPANEKITIPITLENESQVAFELFDISGKLVLSESMGRMNGKQLLEMDISAVERGSYLLKCTVDDHVIVRKITKH